MEQRIADFADIDTRRAMGFPPRKLVVPDLNIYPPRRVGILNLIKLPSGAEFVYEDDTCMCYRRSTPFNFKRPRFTTGSGQ
jgi:hypothetical protein